MQDINNEGRLSGNGVRLIKMAVVYLILGLILGIGMAISGEFQLRPVHTHINLLGWATLALAGVVYCLFPHVSETRMANWHVRLHGVGLPVMLVALTFYHMGYAQVVPVLGIGSLVTAIGLLLFGINLFKNLQVRKAEPSALKSAVVAD